MVPEHDGEIVAFLKRRQAVQAAPLVRIHHDQPGDPFQVQFPDGANVEQVSVESQKILHIGTQLTRKDPGRPGIQVGGGHKGSQGVEIRVGVCDGYLHRAILQA
jgi:hypothetical protein